MASDAVWKRDPALCVWCRSVSVNRVQDIPERDCTWLWRPKRRALCNCANRIRNLWQSGGGRVIPMVFPTAPKKISDFGVSGTSENRQEIPLHQKHSLLVWGCLSHQKYDIRAYKGTRHRVLSQPTERWCMSYISVVLFAGYPSSRYPVSLCWYLNGRVPNPMELLKD